MRPAVIMDCQGACLMLEAKQNYDVVVHIISGDKTLCVTLQPPQFAELFKVFESYNTKILMEKPCVACQYYLVHDKCKQCDPKLRTLFTPF